MTRIRPERLRTQAMSPARPLQHGHAWYTLSHPVGFIQRQVHTKSVAVLHQHVCTMTKRRWFAIPFAHQTSLGIDDNAMGSIPALLTAEVHRRAYWIVVIRPITELLLLLIDGANTLHRGERLDQGTVHLK
jgi:hypothetical protein